jgi:hypothetical protein
MLMIGSPALKPERAFARELRTRRRAALARWVRRDGTGNGNGLAGSSAHRPSHPGGTGGRASGASRVMGSG